MSLISLFHQIDHYILTLLISLSAFTRYYILPIYVWFTTSIPVGVSLLIGISVQFIYEARIQALKTNAFYMGKAVVITEPETIKQYINDPPKHVKRSFVFNTVSQSNILWPILNVAEQNPEDLIILRKIISEAMEYKKAGEEYIETLKLEDFDDWMNIYENVLLILMFKNKLTPERRVEIWKSCLPPVGLRLRIMVLFPWDQLSRFVGLHKQPDYAYNTYFKEYVMAWDLDINKQEDKHKADLFAQMMKLNAHAPAGAWGVLKKAIDENWEFVKDITDPKKMFLFQTDAQRILPTVVDVNWEALEDFVLDLPGGKPIFVPKGFYITTPLTCVHNDEKLNPEPRKIKLDRDLDNNYIFATPLSKPDGAPRGCPGLCLAEYFIPRLLIKYCQLRKERS